MAHFHSIIIRLTIKVLDKNHHHTQDDSDEHSHLLEDIHCFNSLADNMSIMTNLRLESNTNRRFASVFKVSISVGEYSGYETN